MDAKLQDRMFYMTGTDFEAYHQCVTWLRGHACSIGSMQRNAPIGVIFEPGHYIAKHRNLGADAADMHGWITFPGGIGPREGDVAFTITRIGHACLHERSAA